MKVLFAGVGACVRNGCPLHAWGSLCLLGVYVPRLA